MFYSILLLILAYIDFIPHPRILRSGSAEQKDYFDFFKALHKVGQLRKGRSQARAGPAGNIGEGPGQGPGPFKAIIGEEPGQGPALLETLRKGRASGVALHSNKNGEGPGRGPALR